MSGESKPLTVGFVGAGQMATALAKGFLAAGTLSSGSIVACDVVPVAGQRFVEVTGGRLVSSNRDVAQESTVIFLAVKPQQMAAALAELRDVIRPDHLIVSIAAGVSLKTMTAGLSPEARLIRVMPNTPCLVGCGASAFSRRTGAKVVVERRPCCGSSRKAVGRRNRTFRKRSRLRLPDH